MKRLFTLLLLISLSATAQAGFGVQLGAFSPTTGLEDNDNSLLFGAHFKYRFTLLAIKVEGFYVDSSGSYQDLVGEEFSETDIDINSMFAVDLLFYPLGTTFFVQGGLNYTTLDAEDVLSLDEDAIDNELGLDLGLGITLFDKLMVQGKVMYTPNALNGNVADALKNADENLFGFLVTVGWQF